MRIPDWLEDRLLAIESQHAILGPAHRRWSGHSVTINRDVWSSWDWAAGGEEWSSSSDWKASLIEEVLVPATADAHTVLEIGPGAGRWTDVLHARAEELILVDITDTTLDLCRERLGDPPSARYIRTDGASLRGVDTASVDAIWSFDTFVHIAPLDIAAYLEEMARVLVRGGVAVIHHSGRPERLGWRSPMSAGLFARLAEERELEVARQFDSWGDGRFGLQFGDVLTQLRRRG